MKKIYSLFVLVFGFMVNAQIPEILYYKFDGVTGIDVPNLASNPPTGAQTAQIVGNLTLGSNTTCLGNGLVGTGSTGNANYLNTNWNLSLSGSWTLHLKFNNYTNNTTTVYYLLGDGISGGSSFRMFTNGAPGANNVRLTANGMTNVDIPDVFTAAAPIDLIVIYDSTAQNVKAYVNGVLKATVAQANPLNFNGTIFKVGGYGSSITGMKAGMIIDEFGLFNRAITDSEIASLNNFCSLNTNEVIKKDNNRVVVKANFLLLEKGNFGKYSIFDYSGREILSGNESSNAINIAELQSGYYIIKYGDVSTRFRY